ncbi:WD40 repeat-containing protein [Nitzschia inconspicua]|uniref:WD40 repeat-containing protein n=1 Tax=Nitzschia inconspicua TaxID=303405 RepID=A0A9K3LLJ9_9STRA|nr:WD40 repeat-containing protein [Nitzschia inconspicua]
MASNLSLAARHLEESKYENDNSTNEHDPFDESQQTQTQLTQPDHLTPDESSLLYSASSSQQAPLSPPPILPWGRLVPCVPSSKLTAMDFMPNQTEYWLGRSKKCDVTAQISTSTKKYSDKEVSLMEWGKSMISNRHCKIFQENPNGPIYIEDNSGNGTFVNQQTHLRRGQTRLLHSGDEICLVNADTLRKRITSSRALELVLQQFSFIFIQSKPRKPCVNPRAMNYAFRNASSKNNNNNSNRPDLSPRTSRHLETFYELREVLGDGTSGQVRRAIHRQSGKEFAVKIISLRRNLDMTAMEREVQLLQTLDHPYITSLVDVFVQPRMFMYIVMELVKGGDLFDRIVEKERYTEVEARRTMRRLLSAVYYLHEHRNIVHRDLKPENVLCSSSTNVKLADFGLAKIVKADGLKTFCGTPAYFAPEVLQRRTTVAGQGRYGKPADIWSLGVILYILLTGRPPFDADIDESQNQYELDFDDDDSLWSTMPKAKELVQHMLRQDPKRRLTVRQCCDHPWINMEDGDTHCHPLDDPAVTTKKRLFEEVDHTDHHHHKQELHPQNDAKLSTHDDDASSSSCDSSHASKDDASVRSKDDSILSKEEFSHAAVSFHERNDSFFHVDATELEHNVSDLDPQDNSGTKKLEMESHHSESSHVSRPLSPSPRDVKSMSVSSGDIAAEDEKTNDSSNLPKESVRDGSTTCEDNAATEIDDNTDEEKPVDADSPPRSPLAKLNLNGRSNRFREQVLQTSNAKDGYQTAVTPTSSNVRKKDQERELCNAGGGDEADELDPILSQFSSEPSSIESFGDDSSLSSKGTTRMEVAKSMEIPFCIGSDNSKKRDIERDTNTPTDGKSKRARVSMSTSKKQMTLSSWLVKKNNEH